MTFYALGLNHERAAVTLRERFALDEAGLRRLLSGLELSQRAELVILSTCNRTESYLYGIPADAAAVQAALSRHAGVEWPEYASFIVQDEEAVRHIFQVTSGLRSLALGDGQIFSQVKEAYRVAVEERRVGTVLHRLMHSAFQTAKRIINETALTSGFASVPRLAVATARRHFERCGLGGIHGRHVLIIGAGSMARLALSAVNEYEPASVSVANRTAERARVLADAAGATLVDWQDRHEAVARAEMTIVATAAREPVLQADLLPVRHTGQDALLLDISMPRNIDPAADSLTGYTVLDLDRLDQLGAPGEPGRQEAVPAAEQICDEALSEFVSWMFHQQALQPAIQAIRETFERVRRQEVERHHHRFSQVDREELDRITGSIIQKLLAVPVVRLKSVDPDSVDFVHGIRLLHALFSRGDCEDPSLSSNRPSDIPARVSGDLTEGLTECPFEPGADEQSESPEALAIRLRTALLHTPGGGAAGY